MEVIVSGQRTAYVIISLNQELVLLLVLLSLFLLGQCSSEKSDRDNKIRQLIVLQVNTCQLVESGF